MGMTGQNTSERLIGNRDGRSVRPFYIVTLLRRLRPPLPLRRLRTKARSVNIYEPLLLRLQQPPRLVSRQRRSGRCEPSPPLWPLEGIAGGQVALMGGAPHRRPIVRVVRAEGWIEDARPGRYAVAHID